MAIEENHLRLLTTLALLLLLQACKHPLAIVGEGDIVDLNGSGYGCTLEQFQVADAACENDVSGDYFVNYSGVAKPGSRFVRWDGPCASTSIAPHCRFDAPESWVAAWDTRFNQIDTPTLTAVFEANETPVASAGPDQSVIEQIEVTLDGNLSSDSDGTIVSYEWMQAAGTQVVLSSADTASPTFTSPSLSAAQILTFQLSVTDNDGSKSLDTVDIEVNPVIPPPSVNLGPDRVVNEQTHVQLNPTVSSSGGGAITYTWAQISGPNADLDSNGEASITFISPTLVEVSEVIIEFTAQNAAGSDSDTITITVNPVNLSPMADAGPDKSVDEQTLVTLDGLNSGDADGSITSSVWSQTGGSDVALSDASVLSPTFTSPTLTSPDTLTFSLTVVDNEGGGGTDTVFITVNPVNATPIATAGTDQDVDEQTLVILDGSSSSDSDGLIASYAWSQVSGPLVNLSDAGIASPAFTAPVSTSVLDISFQLVVTDNEGATDSDVVVVTVNPVNLIPSVDAGSDQTVSEQTTVTLSGSGSDNDGTVTFLWSEISGSGVAISNPTLANASFSAPISTEIINLSFELTVTDNEGASITDIVQVRVNPINDAPFANAGPDQEVNVQTLVTLDASASSDPDGNIASYLWVQISGTTAALNSPAAENPSFTAPSLSTAETLTFQVTVTDNEGATDSDSVLITVNPFNVPPTAIAGPDQTVSEQSVVTLDGSGSTDSDGSIVSFNWAQLGGTVVALSNGSSATPTFNTPILFQPTVFLFQLTVQDDEGETATDLVSVTANPVNLNPVANAGQDQSVNEQLVVYLDGSASDDLDGFISRYTWTQVLGPFVTLRDADTEFPSFTAPTSTQIEQIEFRLQVEDFEGAFGADNVVITVNPVNSPPTADAGEDQGYFVSETPIVLSGAGTDTDGTIESYSWTQIGGQEVTLENPDNSEASITVSTDVPLLLTFQLEVTDNEAASASDTVIVRILVSNTPVGAQAMRALNDTGQQFGGNYPTGNNAGCIGETIESQDCSQGRDLFANDESDGHAGFSFTKLDSNGNVLDASAQTWSCVRDNITGLIWETKTEEGTIHQKNIRYRWGGLTSTQNAGGTYYDDWDGLLNGTNAEALCGFTNWRVPSRNELLSISIFGLDFSGIDSNYFVSALSDCWTASAVAGSPNQAWINPFWGILFATGVNRDEYKCVVLVRDDLVGGD